MSPDEVCTAIEGNTFHFPSGRVVVPSAFHVAERPNGNIGIGHHQEYANGSQRYGMAIPQPVIYKYACDAPRHLLYGWGKRTQGSLNKGLVGPLVSGWERHALHFSDGDSYRSDALKLTLVGNLPGYWYGTDQLILSLEGSTAGGLIAVGAEKACAMAWIEWLQSLCQHEVLAAL